MTEKPAHLMPPNRWKTRSLVRMIVFFSIIGCRHRRESCR